MTLPFFAGRSTRARLHQSVQRNILRQHRAQHTQKAPSADPHGAAPKPGSSSSVSGPSWAWIGPVLKPFRAYSAMQKRRPNLTQFESSVIVYFCGDLSAQMMSTAAFAEGPYEPVRSLRAMFIGGLFSIPSYQYFLFLGRNFNYGTGSRGHWFSLGVKVLINQMCFTPLISTYFFGMQSLLSGASWEQTKRRVIDTVPVSWKNSWKLWPAVMAFNFSFIPPQSRSVFAGVVAVFWQTYLSWLNKKAEDKEGGKSQLEREVDRTVHEAVQSARGKATQAIESVTA